jgi:hypothetical protein
MLGEWLVLVKAASAALFYVMVLLGIRSVYNLHVKSQNVSLQSSREEFRRVRRKLLPFGVKGPNMSLQSSCEESKRELAIFM